MRNYFVSGQWNVLCDRCGLKKKSGMLRKEWTGLMVCAECFETRHPQTMIKVPVDDPSIEWARPESTDVFVATVDPIMAENEDFILCEDNSLLTTES